MLRLKIVLKFGNFGIIQKARSFGCGLFCCNVDKIGNRFSKENTYLERQNKNFVSPENGTNPSLLK